MIMKHNKGVMKTSWLYYTAKRLANIFLFVECFLLCSALQLGDWGRSRVDLTDGGYTGILVAIDRNVPYNQTFVQDLQMVLSQASSVLFNATDQRAFFRHITVLVPQTWPERPDYQYATSWTQDAANIIIRSSPNASFSSVPFVRQPGRCGQPGEYMHLPSDIFTSQAVHKPWGDTGKVIVHEWAHLRWGLFDEYPMSNVDQFYMSNNGTIEGTRCSGAITGSAVPIRAVDRIGPNPDPRACHVMDGQLPPTYCLFRPDPEIEQTASGSLMYSTSIHSISGFCRSNAEDPSMAHVPEAPTEQNRQCQGQSAWEVMLASPDFSRDPNPSAGNSHAVNTTPTFTFIRHKPRTVLVIDRTSTMRDGEAWRNVVNICERFISEASEDSQVGMVYYSTYLHVNATETLIDMTPSGKQLLLSILEEMKTRKCSSQTTLDPGVGLRKALKMLAVGGDYSKALGANVLLFSGWQGSSSMVTVWVNLLRKKGITVQAVDFGTDDAGVSSISIPRVLEPILLFAFNSPEPGEPVLEDSHHKYMFHDMENNPAFLQVFRQRVIAVAGKNITLRVTIDGSTSRHATFRFSWEGGATPEVEVRSPGGRFYNRSAGETVLVTGSSRQEINFRVPGVSEKGEWQVIVSGLDTINQSVDVQVFSAPTYPASPTIQARPLLMARQADVSSGHHLILYGEVILGENPVIGANVTMNITGPRGDRAIVPLRDNGIGGDTRKDDGIYSAYFTQFLANGTYRLDMKVFGEHAKVRDMGLVQASGRPRMWDSLAQPAARDIAIDPFMRAPSHVEIEVRGDAVSMINADTLPPARISDLEVVSFDADSRVAWLRWTAVGDDYETGTASRYEIRYSNDTRLFARFFHFGVELVDGSFIQSPAPSFQKELFAVTIPANHCTPVCAIRLRAVDEAGNMGEPSNMVAAVERATPAAATTRYPYTTDISITRNMTHHTKHEHHTQEMIWSTLTTDDVFRTTTKGVATETKFTATIIAMIIMFALVFLTAIVLYSVCKNMGCNNIFSSSFCDVDEFNLVGRGDHTSSTDVQIEMTTPIPRKNRSKTKISDALIIEDF